jgi:hypothetical protein
MGFIFSAAIDGHRRPQKFLITFKDVRRMFLNYFAYIFEALASCGG